MRREPYAKIHYLGLTDRAADAGDESAAGLLDTGRVRDRFGGDAGREQVVESGSWLRVSYGAWLARLRLLCGAVGLPGRGSPR
jgi:hypothetical protein